MSEASTPWRSMALCAQVEAVLVAARRHSRRDEPGPLFAMTNHFNPAAWSSTFRSRQPNNLVERISEGHTCSSPSFVPVARVTIP